MMKNKNCSGHDKILITVIKQYIKSVSRPKFYIVNCAFEADIFPDANISGATLSQER